MIIPLKPSISSGGLVTKSVVDVRSLQKPFKEQYRADPQSSRITLTAKGGETASPLSCSVDIGRAIYQAEAHKGVGGSGTAACSGDLLLGALAACAQLTCQLVATAMGIETRHIAVTVDGDMDLKGTLGISKDVPVGFERNESDVRHRCSRMRPRNNYGCFRKRRSNTA